MEVRAICDGKVLDRRVLVRECHRYLYRADESSFVKLGPISTSLYGRNLLSPGDTDLKPDDEMMTE